MKETKRWAIGIAITIALTIITAVYNFGQLNHQVMLNTEDIKHTKARLESVYNLFDSRLNTIIIGLGDLKIQGTVNASQLKSVRDDVKILKEDVKQLQRGK